MYIYENNNWPHLTWDTDKIVTILTEVRNLQGQLVGKMGMFGFDLKDQAKLEIVTRDILTSTEIEGEFLNPKQVRSSVARRLGLDISGLVHSDRHVDCVVEMMFDATDGFDKPLSRDRLFSWHSALFPGGFSGIHKILIGRWRDDSAGPMEVISGSMGKEKVHYKAPPAKTIESEMEVFIKWLNSEQDIDLVIKAALAHLWFVTLHPFEDGNGRIARAITDMILSQSDNQSYRFYSMSSQIRNERGGYYNILEKTQKGSLDITDWLKWFLTCLLHALKSSETILKKVIFKYNFWVENSSIVKNSRQHLMLNHLLDGFEGKLTTSKWAKISKCSQDTAMRDIQYLIEKEILYKLPEGGRSTGYDLI